MLVNSEKLDLSAPLNTRSLRFDVIVPSPEDFEFFFSSLKFKAKLLVLMFGIET